MSYGARIPFGEREGALYRAHEVDNGLACGCLCPACRHPLIAANRGTKVIPYFRHAADSDCVEGFLKGVLLKAREIVLEAQRLLLPAFEETVRDYAYSKVYTRQVKLPAAEVVTERIEAPFDEDGLHADLALWIKGRRLLVIFGVAGRSISGKLKSLRETRQASMVVDLSHLELKTIHDPEAFRHEVLGNQDNRRWVYSPRGEQEVRKAREALEADEARDLEAIRAKEQAWLRQLQQARGEPAKALAVDAEHRPAAAPSMPLAASPALPQDRTAMQVRLNERALAIADSYQQVLAHTGGLARECACCLMASPLSDEPCPYCGEVGPFAPLEVTEYLANTILHRLRCTTRPDRSLERVPQLLSQASQADTSEAAPERGFGG
ncbi:hypothetical protein D3C78_887750 [compost metagenome]